jgi:hypothetical protein
MHKQKRLADAYRFPGFTPSLTVKGVFGDQKARIVELHRRQKKLSVQAVVCHRRVFMTTEYGVCAIFRVSTTEYTWNWKSDVLSVGGARK